MSYPGKNGTRSTFVLVRDAKSGSWIPYTWHHHQSGKHMMLVEQAIHNKITHTGGGSLISVGLKGVTTGPEF